MGKPEYLHVTISNCYFRLSYLLLFNKKQSWGPETYIECWYQQIRNVVQQLKIFWLTLFELFIAIWNCLNFFHRGSKFVI